MNRKAFLALAILGIVLVSGCVQQDIGKNSNLSASGGDKTAIQKYPITETNNANIALAGTQARYEKAGNALREQGWEKEIDEKADFIFTGSVDDVRTKLIEENGSKIVYTYSTVFIDRIEKDNTSSVLKASPMTLVIRGGCADGLCMSVEEGPEFQKGEYIRVYLSYLQDEAKFSVLHVEEAAKPLSSPPVAVKVNDLSIEKVDVIPPNPAVNEEINFNITIKNKGNSGCPQIILMAQDELWGAEVKESWCMYYEMIGVLPPGKCKEDGLKLYFNPGDVSVLHVGGSAWVHNTTGDKRLTVEVSCFGNNDFNYTDNTFVKEFTVR